jgi:hypothetical protein
MPGEDVYRKDSRYLVANSSSSRRAASTAAHRLAKHQPGGDPIFGPEVRAPDFGGALIDSAGSLVARHTERVRYATTRHPTTRFEASAPVGGRGANQLRINRRRCCHDQSLAEGTDTAYLT